MEDDKPCCAASAARKIRKLVIGDQELGIAQLDEIILKVASIGFMDDEVIGKALLKEVKIYNYVPSSREQEYKQAIMDEYSRRIRNGQKD